MLISLAYRLTRKILIAVATLARRDVSSGAELLVLWHENTVWRRQVKKVCYRPQDRLWFAALSGLIPRHRWTEDDDLVAVEHLEAMRTTLPDGRLAIVPGTSRGLPLEKPRLVSSLIFDFLADEQAPKSCPARRSRASPAPGPPYRSARSDAACPRSRGLRARGALPGRA